jgi:hypothetical protein
MMHGHAASQRISIRFHVRGNHYAFGLRKHDIQPVCHLKIDFLHLMSLFSMAKLQIILHFINQIANFVRHFGK